MTNYGVTSDYEYNATHRRERLDIWSGPFYDVWEGEAYSLASGYMLTTYSGDKVRVVCPTPRRDDNYEEIDAAINEALNTYYGAPAVRRDAGRDGAPETATSPHQEGAYRDEIGKAD